ncbi:MAG: RagB/SusD family nutrient uptake outer membrane protein, partial [Bacteroidota bacterium]
MKKIIIIVVLFSLTSCEDFLDIQPKSKFTDDNFWTSEATLRSFSFGLYGVFRGYGNGGYFGGDHF